MKAIILAAGVGSRIRPLTDHCPKSLLTIDGKTILEMMLSHIQDCGIREVVFVLGYLQDQIRDYVTEQFPHLLTHYIINERYTETNTGYSLMLTRDIAEGSTFIKFDADVVFDINILKNLIGSRYENCLCIDKNIDLDAEEVKVIVAGDNRVVRASKTVNPADAMGESIGIEKIGGEVSKLLFAELETMMKEKKNYQEYYEAAYEKLIAKNVPFYAMDITGLPWTEIDTQEDFATAKKIFSHTV